MKGKRQAERHTKTRAAELCVPLIKPKQTTLLQDPRCGMEYVLVIPRSCSYLKTFYWFMCITRFSAYDFFVSLNKIQCEIGNEDRLKAKNAREKRQDLKENDRASVIFFVPTKVFSNATHFLKKNCHRDAYAKFEIFI